MTLDKKEKEVSFGAVDINYYDGISEEKKEIIKDVFLYLNDDSFEDATTRYVNGTDDYGYYQSESSDGIRGLVPVSLCNLGVDYSIKTPIPKEEFEEDLGRCVHVGSQKYATVQIRTKGVTEYPSYMSLIYTDDGHIFVSENGATALKAMDTDYLSEVLGDIWIAEEQKKNGHGPHLGIQ